MKFMAGYVHPSPSVRAICRIIGDGSFWFRYGVTNKDDDAKDESSIPINMQYDQVKIKPIGLDKWKELPLAFQQVIMEKLMTVKNCEKARKKGTKTNKGNNWNKVKKYRKKIKQEEEICNYIFRIRLSIEKDINKGMFKNYRLPIT